MNLGVALPGGRVAIRAAQVAGGSQEERHRDRLRVAVTGGRGLALRPGIHDLKRVQEIGERAIGVRRRIVQALFELRKKVDDLRIGDKAERRAGA